MSAAERDSMPTLEDIRRREAEPVPPQAWGHPVEPNGCFWCYAPQRAHYSRWADGVGFHQYVEPTNPMRLARMKARRERAQPDESQGDRP